MFFLVGDGDNGKTTFLEALRFVVGEYAGQVPIDTFLRKNNDGIPSDIAQLNKLRFVTSSEVPEGRSLDEAKVKYMTGMGTMQGRHLYQDFFEFRPTHKLWVDTNRKPRVAGDEAAVWNRIRVIPIITTIREEDKDKDLLSKLQAEAPGILAWAVRGCLEWQKVGLLEPQIVKDASKAYREESDTVSRFVAECCEVGEQFEERTKDLYTGYIKWCLREDEQAEGKPAFGKVLGHNKALQPCKVGGDRGWHGIKLNTDWHVSHCLQGAG